MIRRRIHEFSNLEFDWLACDAEGFVAMFSSAGFGPVPDESVAIASALDAALDRLKALAILEDVLSVLTKLEQRMSDKERAELSAFGEQFVYMPDHGTKSYEGKDEIIDGIQSGIINRKLVRYRYADARSVA